MPPLISVIIPAYKAERYIEETIRSVFLQTYRHLEIIVVNDGSPDRLEEVVLRLQAQDDRLRYVRQPNGGVSSARNHGFQLSTGEYLAFLDADDVWLPDNLQDKMDKFAAQPELGMVHSDLEVIDEHSQRTGETKSGKEGWLLDDLLLWNGTCVPCPSSILVRRSVLEAVGGFDLQLSNAADQEFFFRVAARYPIGRIPKVAWLYRVHNNNMHSNIALMERDELTAYRRATENKLFKSNAFRRQCFSNMYLIVGASWWGNGKSKAKGLGYLLKAIFTYPPNLGKVFRKILGRKGA